LLIEELFTVRMETVKNRSIQQSKSNSQII